MNAKQLQVNKMEILMSPLGSWAYLVDENNFLFVVLASAQYPERGLDYFLGDFKRKLYEDVPNAAKGPITENDLNSAFIGNLVKFHTTPLGTDSSREACLIKMHECQLEIQKNLEKAEPSKESATVINNKIYSRELKKQNLLMIQREGSPC